MVKHVEALVAEIQADGLCRAEAALRSKEPELLVEACAKLPPRPAQPEGLLSTLSEASSRGAGGPLANPVSA
eukprot:5976155-Lingulodinium_polyedra.AAC.1